MEALITNGIKVTVVPAYEPQYSRPAHDKYLFSYIVTIENQSEETVQLLRRYWHIWDMAGLDREVEGEGVIGEQPILRPGQVHQYDSWCELESGIGNMEGFYLMQKKEDGSFFEAQIPLFHLLAPFLMN
ncbi:MAG: Co2+/Mg2+ efflux protein ApaG [Chitinophagales bacterium]|nr:Co2+/Mg2+ efflux protein ApaG [Chitinophagales bacterium]